VPATPHGCKDATVDPAVIRRWWQQESDLNVAVATGEASGIFVVDIDGADGEAPLRQIEGTERALPPTVEAIHLRADRHLYFKWPDRPVPNSAAARSTPRAHPRHRRQYCWHHRAHRERSPLLLVCGLPRALAAAPEWLLAMI
jgi:hypothetical protein